MCELGCTEISKTESYPVDPCLGSNTIPKMIDAVPDLNWGQQNSTLQVKIRSPVGHDAGVENQSGTHLHPDERVSF